GPPRGRRRQRGRREGEDSNRRPDRSRQERNGRCGSLTRGPRERGRKTERKDEGQRRAHARRPQEAERRTAEVGAGPEDTGRRQARSRARRHQREAREAQESLRSRRERDQEVERCLLLPLMTSGKRGRASRNTSSTL